MRRTLTVLLLCFGSALVGAMATPTAAAQPGARADFQAEWASFAARSVADWVTGSGDNHGLPFVIVDKIAAEVFVFQPDGHLSGASPALLGLARGDHTVPGIGNRALASIRPEERTTPAGRFVAAVGPDLLNDVVWVDYDAAISLHRVITTNPKEHRLARLASPTPLDNRISYGCINVPAAFYDGVVRPAFLVAGGIVYILPEVLSLGEVFPGYGAAARSAPAQPSG